MADKKPRSGAGSDNPGNKPPEKVTDRQKTLVCAEWEVLLMDYLDGALDQPLRVKDAAAFEAHRVTCPACDQLLKEAKRGSEWLHFLDAEPEVPSDLVARILEKTSGNKDAMPVVPAMEGTPLVIVQPGWLPGLERHAAHSRWIMTAAMAFFSIAFTLNLTGVRLSGFRLSDLTPSSIANGLQRQFYAADKGVNRYYNNLRFVYELESRVRQMKRDMAPVESQSQSAPAGGESTQPQQPAQQKKSGGSARKTNPGKLTPDAPAGENQSEQQAEPVMASFHHNEWQQPCDRDERSAASSKKSCSSTDGHRKDRAERSLA